MTHEESRWLGDQDLDMLDSWPDRADFILTTSPPITNRPQLLKWYWVVPDPVTDEEVEMKEVLKQSLYDSCPSQEEVTKLAVEALDVTASKELTELLQLIGQSNGKE